MVIKYDQKKAVVIINKGKIELKINCEISVNKKQFEIKG